MIFANKLFPVSILEKLPAKLIAPIAVPSANANFPAVVLAKPEIKPPRTFVIIVNT